MRGTLTSLSLAPASISSDMGNSEAKPSSLSGHAGAPPPSLMYPTGNNGAKPSSSDGHAGAAASPGLMNPMGASPTAPSTTSSDAHCSTNHASSGTSDTMKPEYPRRPGVADCTYYLKFGTCGYGMKCWFNHPDLHSQSQASTPSEHSKQYFLGKACNFNCHEGKNEVEHVKMNFLGLPLRPGAGLCLHYMHRGTCKFGTNCKYHHPDPKSEHVNANASCHVVQESSQHNFSSEPIQRAHNQQFVPLVTSPTSGTFKIIPTHGDNTCKEHNIYKHGDCSETAKPIHYTRDQLFELRETVGVSQDIDVELAHNDSNVQVAASKQIFGDKIFEAHTKMYEFSAPSGLQEKFSKHDQLSSQLDSNTQVSSIQRGNLSDRDGVLMTVKRILDKLTPEKFDLVKDQLIEAGITRDDILEDVITVMFEKAFFEPTLCQMYAQLCSYLKTKLPSYPLEEPDSKEIAFTIVLLNNCHGVFEGAGNLCAEIDRLTGPDQEMETRNKEIMLMQLQTIGNIRLIGELLKQKILIENTVHHTVQMDENKQGIPDWDTFATKVFCHNCTDEVLAGNRPSDHLNTTGYNNLCAKFNETTKNGYNHEQFRRKCESLKKDYQTWKALMDCGYDLGRDHIINTIPASPEWWAKKMEAMPGCGKFSSAPLENVHLLNIMFEDVLDSSTATPEANMAVDATIQGKHGAGDGNDMGIIDKNVSEQSKETVLQKACNDEPNSTKPKTSCVHPELNHLVNSDENVNPRNSATSTKVNPVGSNISEIMELVVDAGLEEGSDEHFVATQLFARPEYREIFLTLKTPRGRLGWLTKMCQVKELL